MNTVRQQALAAAKGEWKDQQMQLVDQVVTQTRSDTVPLGDLSFGRDRSALFAAPADTSSC